jgi:hypothetical protein
MAAQEVGLLSAKIGARRSNGWNSVEKIEARLTALGQKRKERLILL